MARTPAKFNDRKPYTIAYRNTDGRYRLYVLMKDKVKAGETFPYTMMGAYDTYELAEYIAENYVKVTQPKKVSRRPDLRNVA